MVGCGCPTKDHEHRKLVKAVVKDAVGTFHGPLCRMDLRREMLDTGIRVICYSNCPRWR